MFVRLLLLGLIGLSLVGCRNSPTPPPPTQTLPAQTATPAGTQAPPTRTPIPTPSLPAAPLAAIVNGWAVTQAEYEAELALYRSTQPAEDDDGAAARQQVLDNLINEALLARAAQQAGFVLDDAAVQARLDQLAAQLGGLQLLADWMGTHGYDDETFRWALRRSMAAAWMRDQIVTDVPVVAEQIHARQILLYNSDEANVVLLQLKNGASFSDLAFQFDPTAGGDLGWFPRGYLVDPAVEEAAFSLAADQISEVIASPLGYHIIQVLEIDPRRPVDASVRLVLQEKALLDWVAKERDQSTIEIRVP